MRLSALLRGSMLLAACFLTACSSQPSPPPASAPPAGATTSTASPDARKTAFRAAANQLSRQVNAPVDSIAGVSQDETTWNDSCLGCPQTGENCAQVLTPGYRVVLRVSDATYEYHTDMGGRAKLCSQH
ncbi:MAG TPA: hypothetical protein VGH97_06940 [Thermoanaerobaculia bacterium]